MKLSTGDFSAFFEEVHDQVPFPWQKRLLGQIAETGRWPSVLDLPTGSGKTAALDIAVFHLALEADRGAERSAPVRIALVVDRRLVVDDSFTRAQKLETALAIPQGPVTKRVADRLKCFSGDDRPLIARRLRGGIPRGDDWARTPAQPTILCSTVDQVGSRLLFRGYGVSDSMKPVHAGLLGSDCLILLDEAHLAEPFRQTLDWVRRYRGKDWRETTAAAPWGVALLTATPGGTLRDVFSLEDDDRQHPLLGRRLNASKRVHLITPATSRKPDDGAEPSEEETDGGEGELSRRAAIITKKVQEALDHFEDPGHGVSCPAIGVVVNRVARARAVFNQLKRELDAEQADYLLLIGPCRSLDRNRIAARLAPIRTGAGRTIERPLILVATQCIEVGVDLDLDALISEAAPLDCLRQRFGRLNRNGRAIVPYGAIIAAKSDLSACTDDPVYGRAIKAAWDRLMEEAEKCGKERNVQFGVDAFVVRIDADALARKADAPVLLPAHLDLLSQTSPIPSADPEVALYLHGPTRQPDSITIVWRADISPEEGRDEDVHRLLVLVPPRSLEAIELPLWAVRRWLTEERGISTGLADVATTAPEEEERAGRGGQRRRIFRWSGENERSRWINPEELRPGDTIIVPARYGGVDEFGWNPECKDPATDIGRETAEQFAGRSYTVRAAPGLFESVTDEALADALARAASQRWWDVRAALAGLDLPEEVRRDLNALDCANRKKSITADLDIYGRDEEGRPRGAVFLAPFGIKDRTGDDDGRPNATEDDLSGSVSGFCLSLQDHSDDVERKAECFARAAALPEERVEDLKLAGFLHDVGKADPRFQAWLRYGDPLGPDQEDASTVLAKSGRSLPPAARDASGLPDRWRHEALSVRLALNLERFAEAKDAELVLWLIGSHHGYGRPFFPHHDPEDSRLRKLPSVLGWPHELPRGAGPQSLSFTWHGHDWSMLFGRLKARYGVWELARMEAILRLADHRASEERAKENVE